jgi:hypothetical protein
VPDAKNPWAQLLGKKRLRAPGDLNALRRRIWYAISMAMAGMDDAALHDDGEAVQRWIHCLSQLSNTYVRVSLDSDIESRLKALESSLASQNGHMRN